MNILAVSFTAVSAAIISLSLRRYNAEISAAVAIIGGIIIFAHIILNLNTALDTVKSILASSSVNSAYIVILIKAVGICFLTEFAGDCCIDAGQRALANNVILAGKALVLITALPLYKDVLDAVLKLAGGEL